MRTIGFFGGTFDPVHFGHINVAVRLWEKKYVDEVWFCPAYVSPHKLDVPPVSAEQRLRMLQMAMASLGENYKLVTKEIDMGRSSYTVDTLRSLAGEAGPNVRFRLIIGGDCVTSLHRWHGVEELLEMAPPLVVGRAGYTDGGSTPRVSRSVEQGTVSIPMLDISSTDIRRRLREGLCCDHLVPAKVLDYIYENRLYLTTLQ